MKKSWVYIFVFTILITAIVLVSSINLDLNHDGIINVKDLQLLTSNFEGKASYNSTFDFNNDSRVDLFDIVEVARQINLSSNPVVHTVMPNLTEDFSTYNSTANMLSDPLGIYTSGAGEISDAQDIVLDNTTGYGSSSQSMRYDYRNVTGTSGECQGYTVGRNIKLNGTYQEIWLEVWAKFSSNFNTTPTYITDCGSYNPDFKFIFGRMSSGNSRFEFKEGDSVNALLSAGYPGNEVAYLGDFSMNSKALWDDQWHRYRFHWKVGSGDGIVQVWIDNSLEVNSTNITMPYPNDTIWSIALGRNLDPGASQLQHIWWGSIKVWYQGNNPSWS